MNIRWEHIKQQGWGKTGWDRGHRGEATEGRVELQCLWSFFYSCLLFHILCSPLTFLLHYLLSLFTIPSSTLPSIPRPIPPSHVSVFPELSLFHHPLLHPYPLNFRHSFDFFSSLNHLLLLSNPSVQISQKTRLSTGPVNWSVSTPCGYMMR